MHEAVRPLEGFEALTGGALRDPLLVVAFATGRDPGETGSAALAHLIEAWDALPAAEIEAAGFYDFSSQRPEVRLEDGERVVEWPAGRLYLARPAGSTRDLLLFDAAEPNLRWRDYGEALTELATAAGVTSSLVLRAFPALVPHTRPVPMHLRTADEALARAVDLEAGESTYEGPTDIAGTLDVHWRAIGWRTANLTALLPHYLDDIEDPRAVFALAERVAAAAGVRIEPGELTEAMDEMLAQVTSVIEAKDDMRAHVRSLEEQYDRNHYKGAAPRALPAPAEPLPESAEVLAAVEALLSGDAGPESPAS